MRVLIASFVFGLFCLSASAHRVGVPLTTLEQSDSSQAWELVHKLSLHDVEAETRKLGKPSDFLGTEAGDAWLRNFVERRFVVSGNAAVLDFVGIEYDDDVVWVYFQLESLGADLKITSDLRFNHETTLFSLLNISQNGETESHIFREGNRSIVVDLGSE